MSTSNTHNRGIAHLAFAFGQRPFCRTRLAIICTVPAEMDQWSRLCRRCEAAWNSMRSRAKAKSEGSMVDAA